MPTMTLDDALDLVYGHSERWNPIRPYTVGGIRQSPFDAYLALSEDKRVIVQRTLGREPTRRDDYER